MTKLDTACAIISLAFERIRDLEAERTRRAEQHEEICLDALKRIEGLKAQRDDAEERVAELEERLAW